MKIYTQLLEEIKNDTYKKGDRLPTEKELSERYQVSRITSQKAMNRLVEEGVVVRRPGSGSFVAEDSAFNEERKEIIIDNMEKEHVVTQIQMKGQRRIIGLVIEALWDSFGVGIFDGMYEKARVLGYDLVIKKSYGNQEKEMGAIKELIEMGAVGIVIMPVHGTYYNEGILKLVVEKFPIVFIDRFLSGIHVPFVGSNNIKAGEECIRYLTYKGHEHIGLITAKDQEATTLAERRQGYLQGHINNGVKINQDYIYDDVKCIVPSQWCPKEAEEIVEELGTFLKERSKITAVVATEYYVGKLVKQAAKHIGKRVPEDLSIICFDAPREYLADYEFTHIKQNEEAMGAEAVRMIDELIRGGRWEERLLIETELIEGRSTR